MLMFSKISVKGFVYDLVDVFMFPNYETQKIYDKYKINRCCLDQNLTDTNSTSMLFVFTCDLQCNLIEDKARDIIFELTLKSKIFDSTYQQIISNNLIVEIQILKNKLVVLKLKILINLIL